MEPMWLLNSCRYPNSACSVTVSNEAECHPAMSKLVKEYAKLIHSVGNFQIKLTRLVWVSYIDLSKANADRAYFMELSRPSLASL